MQRGTTCRDYGNQRMMEQIEEVSTLVTLLNRHREEIAGVWAEMVHCLPDSHYSERPLDELRASTLRAVEAIIEALATHSYTALETDAPGCSGDSQPGVNLDPAPHLYPDLAAGGEPSFQCR